MRSKRALKNQIEIAGGYCGVINLSGESLRDCFEWPQVDWLIDSGQLRATAPHTRYTWLSNPDGTMRFLFDVHMPHPVFLSLYNAQGWKGRLIRYGFRLGFHLGMQKVLAAQHHIVLWYKKEHPLERLLAAIPHEYYAVFTGTVGHNRKAVIALADSQGQVTHFVKMPLTEQASHLVRRELNTLAALGAYSWKVLHFPKATELFAGIAVSNVQPRKARSPHQLMRPHLEALYELYNRSVQHKRASELPVWDKLRLWQSEARDAAMQTRRFVPYAMERLIDRLELLTEYLYKQAHYRVPVGWAHGDFTPWNNFIDEQGNVFAYDWELSEPLMPLLWDAFHFIFQSGVLVSHRDFEGLQPALKTLQKHPVCQAICLEYQVDFEWHYHFYLCWIMSYYLPRYLTQINLHTQAFWLINVWNAALDQALSQIGNGDKSGNVCKNDIYIIV